MRATVWSGRNTVQVENVPDPKILNDRDAIVQITSTAICGSDLHLYDGYMPTMKQGDILGHEFMGIVTDVGKNVDNLKAGDRVVVPFPIACGGCNACAKGLFSCCENSNPNAAMAEKVMGHPVAGIFGYSHLTGGFAGGQAEAARVPFADVGPIKIESDLPDEAVLPLSDALPTGWMGAEITDIQDGDVVAVWGAGPVGLYAALAAKQLGAARVILIDRIEYRLKQAREVIGVETINYEQTAVLEALNELTAGRGPDVCVEAVGMEAHHGHAAVNAYDRVKQAGRMETERPHAVREAIMACANGGTVSIMGVYAGLMDKFPLGSLMNRSLTVKTGQCHVHRYMRPLLNRIEAGDFDPSFVFTHTMALEDAAKGYDTFKHKKDGCTKVVLKP
jgi:threonine dehydrogenase-like Zn-dependent dehydrogenase